MSISCSSCSSNTLSRIVKAISLQSQQTYDKEQLSGELGLIAVKLFTQDRKKSFDSPAALNLSTMGRFTCTHQGPIKHTPP